MRGATFGWLLAAVIAVACGGGSGNGSPDQGKDTDPPPPPPPPPPTGFVFGTAGPWPLADVVYGRADGIQESPVVGVTSDEDQNRWVATRDALYLLRPGETTFIRLDDRDGLHLRSNRVHYCNGRPIAPEKPCAGTEGWGGAAAAGISAIAGGGKGEVFVAYFGDRTSDIDCNADGNGEDWCDPHKHSGKIDRVRLNADGTLQVDRMDLVANLHGARYWHNRTVLRLAFDHFVHPHTLYAGADHGVTILFPDRYRLPRDGEWFDDAYKEWMGDHLHARVCFERPCDSTSGNQRMGDWRGLAIDPDGGVWMAGRWSAGLVTWDGDPTRWWQRAGAGYRWAFGDPYLGPGGGGLPPVFEVAKEGHDVHLTSVAVCPDGKVWFGSLGPADGVEATVAAFDGESARFTPYTAGQIGLGERAVQDLVCLPDGRLAIAGPSTGVTIWDPRSGARTTIRAGGGIPSDAVTALEVDRMTDPPALHVATAGGAAILRQLP
jgi:hypothetical protein